VGQLLLINFGLSENSLFWTIFIINTKFGAESFHFGGGGIYRQK